MSKPIERPDTTYLDLSDRILLTKSAAEMVNDVLNYSLGDGIFRL